MVLGVPAGGKSRDLAMQTGGELVGFSADAASPLLLSAEEGGRVSLTLVS